MKLPFINKILNKISLSVLSDNKNSSSRIQSYILLAPILAMTLIFIIIEVWQFIHCINIGKDYYISSEIIIIFGMILSHHLALVFSRKNSQSIKEIKGAEETKEEPAELEEGK